MLLAEDPRPLRERLTRDAKRVLLAAAVVTLVIVGVSIAALIALLVYLT